MSGVLYTLVLLGNQNGEARRAAGLLDKTGLAYTVVPADYLEPRLRYTFGDDPHSEVISLLEIKELIPYLLEEIDKQQAA